MDKWDGYSATRDRILNLVNERGISNLVVLTGDQHNNWANEIKADFNDPNSANLGVEFVGTSISSGGNGVDTNSTLKLALTENPHIKFNNNQRGYVRCTVTPENWQTDFLVLPYVNRPGAPIQTRASFIVEDGKQSLQQLEAAQV